MANKPPPIKCNCCGEPYSSYGHTCEAAQEQAPGPLDAASCSAPSYEEVCGALDKLHITCESAEPDVYRWYLRHPYASRARAKAISVLNRLQQSQNV